MTEPAPSPAPGPRRRRRHLLGWLAALLVIVPVGLWLAWAASERFTHSITWDAFVDSHLVNVAPRVAGAIVEVRVQEQEQAARGQLLAIVDPAIYQQRLELAQARQAAADEALEKARVDLELLTQTVPRRITIAELRLEIAQDEERRAADTVAMTTVDIDQGVSAAGQAVEAARANLTMAAEDYRRYAALSEADSATTRRFQEADRTHKVAQADVRVAEARLGQAEAGRNQIAIARHNLQAAGHAVAAAREELELARLGDLEIAAMKAQVAQWSRAVEEARAAVQLSQVDLDYTRVVAPFDCVIAKKWRHQGDYARAGEPIFNVYNPQLLYVTTNLEETLLEGVAAGNHARLDIEAFDRPFRGRVLWVGNATDAEFSLIPRDVSAGEFTYVVQRVPVRIWIERDERWSLLKPGLSVRVSIEHGPGDPAWAAEALRRQAEIEALGTVAP